MYYDKKIEIEQMEMSLKEEHPYHGHAESMKLPAYCEDCPVCRAEKKRLEEDNDNS